MYKKRTNTWHEYTDFILLELLCMVMSFFLSYLLRYGWDISPYTEQKYMIFICVTLALDACIAIFFNNFGDVLKKGYYRELMSSLKHVLMVFAAVTLYLFAMQESSTYSRIVLFSTFGFDFIFGYISRVIYKKSSRARRFHRRSVLIIASSSEFDRITDGFNKNPDKGIVVCGYAALDYLEHEKLNTINTNNKYDIVATAEDVIEYVCREWVDEVLIKASDVDKRRFINKLTEMGVTVHTVLDAFDSSDAQQLVETMAGMTVVTSSIKTATAGELFIKRLMDVTGGIIGCVLTIIIGIIIAPFILIKSPGHLIFRQTRVGMNGKKFKMLKFRSMIKDADAKKAELLSQNTVSNDMMFKLDWDPRVIGNRITKDGKRKTGIGEFIRKTSIDELPQFFNVLLGNMSLVGTRPPTVDEWEKYDLHHRARLAVRPGITGMWQVSGRSDITDFEEVVKLDTEYIYNWSIGLDIRILVKTIGAVLKGKGAK